MSDLCKAKGMETKNNLLNHDLNFVQVDTWNLGGGVDMISAILDGTHSDEADHCSRDAAGVSKLPQINGEFWELFLKPSPH